MSKVSPIHKSRALAMVSAASILALVGVAGVVMAGCPIYAADSCEQDPNCTGPQTTTTPPVYDSGPVGCGDCAAGYVCSALGTGRYSCVPYDCRASEKACATGQSCVGVGSGAYVCQSASDDAGTDATTDASADTGSDAADTADTTPPPVDCVKTGCISGLKCLDDGAGGHSCGTDDPNACPSGNDADCVAKTGAGSLCLGGICKAPKDLCSDSTQCDSTKTCEDGRCVPKCTSGSCAAGYTCDASSGLCTGGALACGGSSSSGDAGTDGGDAAAPKTCSSSSTCKGTHCVDKCATDGSCKSGLVCVGGGCVPDERAIFFCDLDGTKDGTQDLCASGSICLHHNCYLSCTGPTDTTSCAPAGKFPVCKSVTTSSGDHYVCGSSTNLGSACDPTSSPPKTCAAGKVCIDGFCN
jgi:hypothetical protein